MKIIAIIPARGGSKSIPKKNIVNFIDKPLIAHSIETGIKSALIDRVITSTDDQEIAEIAMKHGSEVPFLRPSEYAKDDTPDLPVFLHCLEWLDENESYQPDIIVHLRPTSPLRTVKMVDDAISMLIGNPEADSVRTVCEPTQNPFKMWQIGSGGMLKPLIKTKIYEQYNQPRQELPTVYWQNGYVDVTRRNTIVTQKSMTGDHIMALVLEGKPIIDIDDKLTLEIAEKMYLNTVNGN